MKNNDGNGLNKRNRYKKSEYVRWTTNSGNFCGRQFPASDQRNQLIITREKQKGGINFCGRHFPPNGYFNQKIR